MSKFFINRPIVAMVIAIFFVITGAVMIFRLPVAQFPDIVPPQIQTTATYPGADALTVEQSVATPIEEQVNGAKNMLYMQSINNNDGTMTLQVSFAVGTDVDLDQVQVQNRLSQATSSLPNAVSNYGLTTQQTVGIPLLVFSITSPNRTWDQTFLANYVAINITDELARIPGIGQVKLFGASNYAMRIWVAPDILSKLQLTVADLENAIAAQNVVNPAGQIGGAPAPPGQQLTYTVRAQGRLLNADEFGNIIVRANPDGSLVRLKDVARIQLGAETYTQQAYTNGAPSAIVGLYQNPGSNALAAAKLAKAKMAELARHFPSDMNVDLTLDTTIPVTEGAREIVKTLLEAIGLVILVVFIFLQNWRATLIPMLTIPVSLVGAFMFFPAVGFSINTLALLGLVLAVGLVVDDAIVVVEAIEAKIEQGAVAERRGAGSDGRGRRSAGRDRTRAVRGLHPSRIHGGNNGLALSPVRADDRLFSPALGLQRSHAEPGARRAAATSEKHRTRSRAARARLRAVQRGFRAGAKWLRPDLRSAHPQGRDRDPFAGGLCRPRRRAWKNSAAIIPARRRSRLLFYERGAPARRFA